MHVLNARHAAPFPLNRNLFHRHRQHLVRLMRQHLAKPPHYANDGHYYAQR